MKSTVGYILACSFLFSGCASDGDKGKKEDKLIIDDADVFDGMPSDKPNDKKSKKETSDSKKKDLKKVNGDEKETDADEDLADNDADSKDAEVNKEPKKEPKEAVSSSEDDGMSGMTLEDDSQGKKADKSEVKTSPKAEAPIPELGPDLQENSHYYYTWIQKAFGQSADGSQAPLTDWWVRSISIKGNCPTVDNEKMNIRFDSSKFEDSKKFSDAPSLLVCEYQMKSYAVSLSYPDGRTQTLSRPTTQTSIFLVGNTGRNNLSESPVFKDVAQKIVSQENINHTTTLHLGNFIFSNQKAKTKETWQIWQDEFFQAAQPLLAQTPFIFTRGDSESCKLEGGFRGWFYFFDAKAGPVNGIDLQACEQNYNIASSYLVSFGKNIIGVLDSSNASPSHADRQEILKYSTELALLNDGIKQLKSDKEHKNKQASLVSHRPFWGLSSKDHSVETMTLQKAYHQFIQASAHHLPGFKQIISGHENLFDLLKFHQGKISQVIVGNSGNRKGRPYKHSNGRVYLDLAAHGAATKEVRRDVLPKAAKSTKGYGVLTTKKNRHGHLKTIVESCSLSVKSNGRCSEFNANN